MVANKKEKMDFLRNVLIEFGLVPENLDRERSIDNNFKDGVRGEPSEDGADVM